MNTDLSMDKLPSDERRKMTFLKEVEETMQQISNGRISMQEGYEMLLTLMEKKEIQQIIEIKGKRPEQKRLF